MSTTTIDGIEFRREFVSTRTFADTEDVGIVTFFVDGENVTEDEFQRKHSAALAMERTGMRRRWSVMDSYGCYGSNRNKWNATAIPCDYCGRLRPSHDDGNEWIRNCDGCGATATQKKKR